MHTNTLHVYGKQSDTSRYAVIKEPYSVDIHCTVTYYPTHSLTLFFLLFCHRTADRLNCNAFHPFCSVPCRQCRFYWAIEKKLVFTCYTLTYIKRSVYSRHERFHKHEYISQQSYQTFANMWLCRNNQAATAIRFVSQRNSTNKLNETHANGKPTA